MRHLLLTEKVAEIEQLAEEAGVPRATLMERAGLAVANRAQGLSQFGRVVVFCGTGNNGGDGWVAARHLVEYAREVNVVCACGPDELCGLARDAAAQAIACGVPWIQDPDADTLDILLSGAVLIIDAMLGSGARGAVREPYASWIGQMNGRGIPVLAVDIPTGLSGDTGMIEGAALRATTTLCTIAVKPGMVGGQGGRLSGTVLVDDLGCDALLPGALAERSLAEEWDVSEYRAMLPLPAADAYKYTRGRVLVVAGSARYPGAAVLAASAASRSGAGYVKLACPQPVVAIEQCHLVSVLVEGFSAEDGHFSSGAADEILQHAGTFDSMVLGPGIVQSDATHALVERLIAEVEEPLLIDADALGITASCREAMKARAAAGRVTVLTPHEGEMRRLLAGIGAQDMVEKPSTPAKRVAMAKLAADAYGAVVVFKGPATVIADASKAVESDFGTPALATAGTGDVLSGIIGAFLAQGLDPLHASALGVYLHGRAGEAAARVRSEVCVVAEDVIDGLGEAVLETLDGGRAR